MTKLFHNSLTSRKMLSNIERQITNLHYEQEQITNKFKRLNAELSKVRLNVLKETQILANFKWCLHSEVELEQYNHHCCNIFLKTTKLSDEQMHKLSELLILAMTDDTIYITHVNCEETGEETVCVDFIDKDLTFSVNFLTDNVKSFNDDIKLLFTTAKKYGIIITPEQIKEHTVFQEIKTIYNTIEELIKPGIV